MAVFEKNSPAQLSRRQLLELGALFGISVSIVPAPALAKLEAGALSSSGATRRFDALAKVTGAKTFTRDYRARDLGWPDLQAHAFLLCSDRADRRFAGVELSVLGKELAPDRLVLHEDLVADGLTPPTPEFYGDTLLVPHGATPRLLGQPVALLIYYDFDRFNAARALCRANRDLIRYGEETPFNPPPHYGAARYIRVFDDAPDAPDKFSAFQDAIIYGGFEGDRVVWPSEEGADETARGMRWAGVIAARMAHARQDEFVFRARYSSQSVDPSAMEADNGLTWLSGDTFHLMVATQSPYEVAEIAAEMLSRSRFKPKSIALRVGYTVGYGSKEHHVFPLFAIVAGLYGDGRPVRLANDRFEQFRLGLKRHAFKFDNAMLVNRSTGRIEAFVSDMRADGGGRPNFSASVAMVAATAAQSIYDIPKTDIATAAFASRAVEAGSMRGYGTLQSMSATEMMIDEIAGLIGMDAIELRLRNVMKTGMRNTQGITPAGALRNDEILERARKHPLWVSRDETKKLFESENPGQKYGVGFAQVQKDFGTGAEAAFAALSFDMAGAVRLRHSVHEIGTGATTAQLRIVEDVLGIAPDSAEYGVTEWPELPLKSRSRPYSATQAEEDEAKRDPYWTPALCSPMSASNSAYFKGHATRQAAQALLELAIIPAARSIWARGAGGGALSSYYLRDADIVVNKGFVSGGGMAPLRIRAVMRQAHRLGLLTGAAVHTFNRWQWAEAEFDVSGRRITLAADALAVCSGATPADRPAWRFVERSEARYPPVERNNAGVTYYTPMATLVELAVDSRTGAVRILSHHSILECGKQLVPELVSGQAQGGLAMGVGHALFEHLPLYEGGPGDGTWNWDRYHLPRASDVAVWSQTLDVLPALSPTDPPKGMAEVTMIPIVPAIANAVAHAIGKRSYSFPLTADRILEALK